jgi:hypothetical protein
VKERKEDVQSLELPPTSSLMFRRGMSDMLKNWRGKQEAAGEGKQPKTVRGHAPLEEKVE